MNDSTPFIGMSAMGDIQFYCSGTEMLRIARDGFYVRGQLLEQDDTEAEQVYNSFTQWLAWQQLQR